MRRTADDAPQRHTCKRTVARGPLSFARHAGMNKVSFQGRISHAARLRPGRYTLVITATNVAGKHSAAIRLNFAAVH